MKYNSQNNCVSRNYIIGKSPKNYMNDTFQNFIYNISNIEYMISSNHKKKKTDIA